MVPQFFSSMVLQLWFYSSLVLQFSGFTVESLVVQFFGSTVLYFHGIILYMQFSGSIYSSLVLHAVL